LDAWLDEDTLCWGDDLHRSIRSAIRTGSDFVLIFLDDSAIRSVWVRRELEWALEHESQIGRTFLLPIVVAIPTDALPDTLRDRVQLRLADYQQASVSSLASQIAEHLFQLVVRSFDLQNAGGRPLVEAQDHDKPNLVDKVAQLADKIVQDDFSPDVIIGIPRGGLVVAAFLSKQMEQHKLIPVVSLWPHPGFENSLNHVVFTPKDFNAGETDKVKVLIVDDICRSGKTLMDARAYLERRIDASIFVIKTAAVSYYEGLYTGATPPTYFVDKPSTAIRDFGGDVEPIVD